MPLPKVVCVYLPKWVAAKSVWESKAILEKQRMLNYCRANSCTNGITEFDVPCNPSQHHCFFLPKMLLRCCSTMNSIFTSPQQVLKCLPNAPISTRSAHSANNSGRTQFSLSLAGHPAESRSVATQVAAVVVYAYCGTMWGKTQIRANWLVTRHVMS